MKEQFPNYESIKSYINSNFELAYNSSEKIENYFNRFQGDYKSMFNDIRNVKPLFFKWKDYNFPIFIHQNQQTLFDDEGKISFDIFLNAFLFLSGWQEIIGTKKDSHSRFPYHESLQYKYNFTEIPVVNIYFELLREVALKNKRLIEPINFPENIIFTHDIDQLRSGWFEDIQMNLQEVSIKSFWYISKNVVSKMLGLKDSYLRGMERMLTIDKENNIEAISFFIPVKSHKDADFNLAKKQFLNVLQKAKKTQTVAIHPGYETFNNIDEYKKQLKTLEKLSGQKITKSRQHFLRYDIHTTPFIQEELKIEEDYTLGFAEQYGFRNGIANSFYLFNFKTNKAFPIKQFPLVFMDVSLTNYNLDNNFEKVLSFLEKIKQDFNGEFSILFHNSVFSNGKYDGFEGFYKKIIRL